MKFSIIIINYFQKEYLDSCIESIYKYFTSESFEVIIINNSPEQNINYLPEKYVNLKIIENSNKGFSEGNNKGVKYASGEYLFFLNADTLICNDFLRSLTDEFEEGRAGIIGLKLLNADMSLQLSCWFENTFLNEVSNKTLERKFSNNAKEVHSKFEEVKDTKKVEWVTGAAIVMRREIFEKLNGFDEDYFLFYEDADICKRASKYAIPVYYFPKSEIIHLKGENVNNKFKSDTYYYSKESQLIYYKKHNSLLNRILLRSYLLLKFSFLNLVKNNDVDKRILNLLLGTKR